MKTKLKKFTIITIIAIIIFPILSLAITEIDNGIMKISITSGGLEFTGLKGFDIQGYVSPDKAINKKTLISSTFGNKGYHTFLNVNGKNGEMTETLTDSEGKKWEDKALAMQYTAYDSNNEWQNIDGINLNVNTQFINNGEQLQIVYTLKNTTSSSAIFSLATAADVEIDEDDHATIERLEDGSGVKLWTKEGSTKSPVQFVFYGKDVAGSTNVDNLWIGSWGHGSNIRNMFIDNSDILKIEDKDSSFAYSWVNRNINAGETQTYSVLMEVGEINIPNTSLTLENNTKFYYSDVIINGSVFDKDLKDKITIHYSVDGTKYSLPEMSTTGVKKDFSLDLTSLNLSAVTPHTLEVWSVDSTNCTSNVEKRTFIITYLKNPTLTLSENEWTKNNVTFRIDDNDNPQQYVNKYEYRINNGEWTVCQKNTDVAIQENGLIKIDARISGTQTGDYSDIITNYAKIDRINPTTTVPTATKTTCSISVNSVQTDIHSGIDTTKTMYAIKTGTTWSDWQSDNTFTGLTHNTEYIVKTKSTDKAGNTSESEELTIKTDELLFGNLILKLNNSEGEIYTEDTWTNQNIYIAIQENSTGATTKYKSKENSAQNITETNQETTVTQNGISIITLLVTDGTNIITSNIEHILKVDKIAPVITELSLDNDEWSTSEKSVTGKAIDELSGITSYMFSNRDNISSDWNDITPTTSEITQNTTTTENEKIYFYVKDVAGNIASVNIDTKIDSLGPVITFTRTNGKTIINVTDTGAGVKSTEYAWTTENIEPNEDEWNNYYEAVKYTGTSKEKLYLWAKSTDNANNTTISSTLFNTIKKPSIICEDSFVNEYANFKLNSDNEDNDITYQFKINDEEWKDITKDSTNTITNIQEGEITISARVLDNAGRYSEVTIKKITVSIMEIPNNNSSNGNYGKVDNTISNNILPQTGLKNIILIVLFIALLVGSTLIYRKFSLYKDIK